MTRLRRTSVLFFLFLFVALPCFVQAQPQTQEAAALRLGFFTVQTLSDTKVHVDSGIVVDKLKVVRNLLRDGAVLNFTCKLTIERLRSVLSNDVLAEHSETFQIRHDPLTRDFCVLRQGLPSQCSKKLDTIIETACGDMPFTITLLEPLVSGEKYRVRLDVTLQHAEVPPWLEKALFFWSWDVAPPTSFIQDFVY